MSLVPELLASRTSFEVPCHTTRQVAVASPCLRSPGHWKLALCLARGTHGTVTQIEPSDRTVRVSEIVILFTLPQMNVNDLEPNGASQCPQS